MTETDLRSDASGAASWPALPFDEWQDTYATLHMWTQIIGKVRLAQTPLINHWWNVPLYVSPRGLTTSVMHHGRRSFEIEFDFISHRLKIDAGGPSQSIALEPRSVADFYREVMAALRALNIEVDIYTMPVEIPDPIRFTEDRQHATYNPEHANRLRRILAQTDAVFTKFRSRFIGKCSPVHFFWGSFDLAVTRFSGRPAPTREGADSITREAYSHEVISCGFWPGSGNIKAPAFYAYCAPEPPGYPQARVRPEKTFYNPETSGFVLFYDDVRLADNPEETLLDFLQTTYEAGANLAGWDRASLERATTGGS